MLYICIVNKYVVFVVAVRYVWWQVCVLTQCQSCLCDWEVFSSSQDNESSNLSLSLCGDRRFK